MFALAQQRHLLFSNSLRSCLKVLLSTFNTNSTWLKGTCIINERESKPKSSIGIKFLALCNSLDFYSKNSSLTSCPLTNQKVFDFISIFLAPKKERHNLTPLARIFAVMLVVVALVSGYEDASGNGFVTENHLILLML